MKQEAIQVSRIYRMDGEGKTKAFADVSFFGTVIVKGVRIVSGSKGLFVSMPRHQGKDGKWYNTVDPANEDIQKELSNLVLSAYKG